MVKIRLRRVGAKKQPSYRLVVADSRAPRDGAFIAVIGHYNPLTNPETIVIDQEKALGWLKQGALPTDTAARLLAKAGIIAEPADRKAKMKAGTPDKPKASKKKGKAAAEAPKAVATAAPAAEAPKAVATEEAKAAAEAPKAEVAEKPKAEVTEEPAAAEEPKAEVAEKPKAEVTEEPAAAEEPKAEVAKEPEAAAETSEEQS